MQERKIDNRYEWTSAQGVKATLRTETHYVLTYYPFEYYKEWDNHSSRIQWNPRIQECCIEHRVTTDTYEWTYLMSINRAKQEERVVAIQCNPIPKCTLYQWAEEPWSCHGYDRKCFWGLVWVTKWRARKRRRLVARLFDPLLPPVLLTFIPL